ncbi:hypothetical protein [Kitasatospora cheerisanensis]|uniref:Uncharacterized protein n=1 Tax=Kitasatospora cheerisanensis KCTC 2395 TaxID=1348663 RepID=A0A066YUE6_9ACTN|nr:hypothetical protein [Kitasatospora cheerisanensis]KDN81676.1 hypothetical protein KCH_63960 [Kitasatospora cheerisanensis KCTC 2395]
MKIRSRFATLGALGMVAGSMLFSAAPAQAFGSLQVRYAIVDTSNCRGLEGSLSVVNQAAGCFLDDSADDTFFKKEAGGVAVKIELRDGSGLVAKAEFHPLGDELWVYDTRNDGDSIYVTLQWGDSLEGPVSPPGTGTEVEYTKEAHGWIPEGAAVTLRVYDNLDQYGTPYTQIGGNYTGRA